MTRRACLLVALAAAALLACDRGGGDAARLDKAVNDPAAYARQVDAECAAGRAASCTSVGTQLAFGTYGRAKDPAAAAPFLARGCAGGDAQGCHELGVLHEHGRGVAKDAARARELYAKACAGGVAGDCGR